MASYLVLLLVLGFGYKCTSLVKVSSGIGWVLWCSELESSKHSSLHGCCKLCLLSLWLDPIGFCVAMPSKLFLLQKERIWISKLSGQDFIYSGATFWMNKKHSGMSFMSQVLLTETAKNKGKKKHGKRKLSERQFVSKSCVVSSLGTFSRWKSAILLFVKNIKQVLAWGERKKNHANTKCSVPFIGLCWHFVHLELRFFFFWETNRSFMWLQNHSGLTPFCDARRSPKKMAVIQIVTWVVTTRAGIAPDWLIHSRKRLVELAFLRKSAHRRGFSFVSRMVNHWHQHHILCGAELAINAPCTYCAAWHCYPNLQEIKSCRDCERSEAMKSRSVQARI